MILSPTRSISAEMSFLNKMTNGIRQGEMKHPSLTPFQLFFYKIKALKSAWMMELIKMISHLLTKKSQLLRVTQKMVKKNLEEIIRHKVRLVAKGYSHRQGINFEEVFALVV